MVLGAENERGGTVLHEAYRVMVWSLEALRAGRHPERDHNGVAFPAGSERAAKAGFPLGPHGLSGKIVEV